MFSIKKYSAILLPHSIQILPPVALYSEKMKESPLHNSFSCPLFTFSSHPYLFVIVEKTTQHFTDYKKEERHYLNKTIHGIYTTPNRLYKSFNLPKCNSNRTI